MLGKPQRRVAVPLLRALARQDPNLDISAEADRNPPFMLMSDGSVRNAFTVKLRNMQSRPRSMRISLEGLPGVGPATASAVAAAAGREGSVSSSVASSTSARMGERKVRLT